MSSQALGGRRRTSARGRRRTSVPHQALDPPTRRGRHAHADGAARSPARHARAQPRTPAQRPGRADRKRHRGQRLRLGARPAPGLAANCPARGPTTPELRPARLQPALGAARSAQLRQMQAMARLGSGTAASNSAGNATLRHQQASPKDPVAAGRHSLGPPQSGHSGSGSGRAGGFTCRTTASQARCRCVRLPLPPGGRWRRNDSAAVFKRSLGASERGAAAGRGSR